MQAYTTRVSCQDHHSIKAVASTTWAAETTISMPPNCMKVLMVSTSPVTRDTSDPRRSEAWCSTDRSWTRRKALVRKASRPSSVVR